MNASPVQIISTWATNAMAASWAALSAEGEPWSQVGILTIRAHEINWQNLYIRSLKEFQHPSEIGASYYVLK